VRFAGFDPMTPRCALCPDSQLTDLVEKTSMSNSRRSERLCGSLDRISEQAPPAIATSAQACKEEVVKIERLRIEGEKAIAEFAGRVTCNLADEVASGLATLTPAIASNDGKYEQRIRSLEMELALEQDKVGQTEHQLSVERDRGMEYREKIRALEGELTGLSIKLDQEMSEEERLRLELAQQKLMTDKLKHDLEVEKGEEEKLRRHLKAEQEEEEKLNRQLKAEQEADEKLRRQLEEERMRKSVVRPLEGNSSILRFARRMLRCTIRRIDRVCIRRRCDGVRCSHSMHVGSCLGKFWFYLPFVEHWSMPKQCLGTKRPCHLVACFL
jgi:chromosome segregation ATPase